jgi:hypothetical protein
MCNADWRRVYGEERRRPGYVIENGKPPAKAQDNSASAHFIKASTHPGKRAARSMLMPFPGMVSGKLK